MAPVSLLFACLTKNCRPIPLSYVAAVGWCFSVSILFVAALYFLVPAKVRQLDRNAAIHIKWRTFAVFTVCTIVTILFPILMCSSYQEEEQTAVSALKLMGWTSGGCILQGVLLQANLLYTGPIVTSLLYTKYAHRRLQSEGKTVSFLQTFYMLHIEPIVLSFSDGDSSQRWSQIRNLLVAPLTEEVIFRGCMVYPLLLSGLTPLHTCLVAPLFFGTAHFHHALLKYKQGMPIRNVVMLTTFQFAYTSLFGAYATVAFIRTGSISAITLSHSFCNLMGLPDFGFMKQKGARLSCLYPYRWTLLTFYLVGICMFAWSFKIPCILPSSPGRLADLMLV
jgi:prenyl protein peptidase